jgi:hypothetical protein
LINILFLRPIEKKEKETEDRVKRKKGRLEDGEIG